jgi:tripartite-type tricarboxylate transporter receptor subunit TctC
MKKMAVMMFLGLFLLAGSVEITLAQGKYPVRPIDWIAPYSPGGGVDILFRNTEKIISQYKLVPQPINVINKGGGGGAIGKAFALARPADGYTLTCFDIGTVSQQIDGKANWDYRKDFAYIARLVLDFNLLIVRADFLQHGQRFRGGDQEKGAEIHGRRGHGHLCLRSSRQH